MRKSRFKKSEMHGDLPSGAVVSASEHCEEALYKYSKTRGI
jgi:hypothetical protein